MSAPGGPPAQDWETRYAVASEVFMPWLEGVFPLAGKRVLEYGSGEGSISCAVAERAGVLAGYDIDDEAVEVARERAAEHGLENATFAITSPEEIFAEVRGQAGEVDVFLLYAVLEHLTIPERLEALRVAREVVRADGVIVVVETPNRLVDIDTHTSLLPFFDQLPAELALEYADRSPRPEFRDDVAAGRESESDGGAMRLARWGTGASFHEFELIFGDLRRHVIAGGYDFELLAERDIHAEEIALARELERVRPDLPPPFSRYWLDFVLSPAPVDPSAIVLVRPWSVETSASEHARLTEWDTIAIGAHQPLRVTPRAATRRIVCVFTAGTPTVEVSASSPDGEARAQASGRPTYPMQVELELAEPAGAFALEFSEAVHVQFVGYGLPSASEAAVA